jgi:tyrosinase
MRTRRDVWKLANDLSDKTLYWYSVAVGEMQTRMFDQPLSWKFQAAVHGYKASLYPPLRPGEKLPVPGIQAKYWNNCEHASWFFLPWHRIYVFLFEQLCRNVILAKNGPKDWALPYWDYSHPSTAKQRTLPDPFRQQKIGGTNNPLYTNRAPGVNTGGVVGTDQQSENTTCMKSSIFSGVLPNGFGGGPSTPMQFSGYTGSCENAPHNLMHDAIGGTVDWMGDPYSAALDPIFWLHHANIDRLWVTWQGAPNSTFPSDPAWNSQTFDFFDPAGNPKSYAVKDVLQTKGPLCDYIYENTTNPLGPTPVSVTTGKPSITASGTALEALARKVMRKSQVIGASTEPSITLGSGVASVSFPLHEPAPIADIGKRALSVRESAAPSQTVHLALENITATDKPIYEYEVYLSVPEGAAPRSHPELLAGITPRFGLLEASESASKHGGQGLNLSFDITEIVSALQKKGEWDPKNLRVTFAPHDAHIDAALASEGRPVPARQSVTVGRVSVYTLPGI